MPDPLKQKITWSRYDPIVRRAIKYWKDKEMNNHQPYTDWYTSSLRAMTEEEKLTAWFKNREDATHFGPKYETKEMNEYTKKIKNLIIDYDNEEDFNVIRNLFDKLDIPYNKSDKYKYCTYMFYTLLYNRTQFETTGGTLREVEKTYLPQLVRILFSDDKVKMTIGEKEFYISKESADSIKEGLK